LVLQKKKKIPARQTFGSKIFQFGMMSHLISVSLVHVEILIRSPYAVIPFVEWSHPGLTLWVHNMSPSFTYSSSLHLSESEEHYSNHWRTTLVHMHTHAITQIYIIILTSYLKKKSFLNSNMISKTLLWLFVLIKICI
jgi:hypothetical protein